MDIVHRFGYLAVGVSNLAEATEFYSRFVRLDLTERVGSTAFMTAALTTTGCARKQAAARESSASVTK